MEANRRWTLGLLATASFVAVVDTTIVSIALPSIRQSLGFTTAGAQWVLNAYALVFGGLLLLSGRLGDLYGRKRLFGVGVSMFGVGSVVAGVAWSEVIAPVGALTPRRGRGGLHTGLALAPDCRLPWGGGTQ